MKAYSVTISREMPIGRVSLKQPISHRVSFGRRGITGSARVEHIKSSSKIGAKKNIIYFDQKAATLFENVFVGGQSAVEHSSSIISHAEKFLSAEANRLTVCNETEPNIYSGSFIAAEQNQIVFDNSDASISSTRLALLSDLDDVVISDIADSTLSENFYLEY